MNAFSYHGRNFGSDERGVAMLEMAVVLPVLLAIGLGVMEFGNAIYNRHLIENGVRDAARYAAGRPADCACDADIKDIAMTGELGGVTYRVAWWTDPNTIAVTYPCFDNDIDVAGCAANSIAPGTKIYRGGDSITMVTVTATVPYQQLGFLTYFGLGAPTFHASHEERVFGVR